mmetsp:Transcript_26242/g.84656  ORF Transcript_26242/g.84656 Transcript_26242/m.84656 type:complete len:110 (+) Transcript_26242:868-1197(+)
MDGFPLTLFVTSLGERVKVQPSGPTVLGSFCLASGSHLSPIVQDADGAADAALAFRPTSVLGAGQGQAVEAFAAAEVWDEWPPRQHGKVAGSLAEDFDQDVAQTLCLDA